MRLRVSFVAIVAVVMMVAASFIPTRMVHEGLRWVDRPYFPMFTLHGQSSSQSGNPPVVVQQVPTDLRACSVAHNDQAVNVASPTATITITPPNGWYVYICGWDFQVVPNATGTASTNLKWTTSNLGGWAVEYSTAATTPYNYTAYFPVPIRAAQAGVAVTFITPAALLNVSYSHNAYYYYNQF